MKNTLKLFAVIALIGLTMAALSLTACGGDDGVTTVSVTGVTLNKSTLSLTVGGTETLTATVAPDNATNKAFSWSTSNVAVATVANGLVTAISAGSTTITVTTADGNKTADCAVTVTNGDNGETGDSFVAVTSITDVPTTVVTNEELTLTGTVNPSTATNKTITWTIKDQGGTNSTLNENKLTAANAGTVKVTATITNGQTANTNYTQDFDITVTQFEGNHYTVTFKNWNGDVLKTQEVNEGSHATAPDNPTREGYTFSGWDKTYNNVTSDLTVTAQYTLNQTPVAGDYNFGNLSQTAGSVTAVTITPKDGKSTGARSIKYTGKATIPQTAGTYDVTFDVAAVTGWNAATNLSAGNLVVSNPNLSGNITISPNTGVTTGMTLTAYYSGSETVSYQWKNGSTAVSANSNKFTPTTAGSYTVTVSAADYNSKVSDAVTVTQLAAGYEVMYWGVALASDIPFLKGEHTQAEAQEALDDALNAKQITADTINKTISKSIALNGNGVVVILVPTSLGDLIIKDSGNVVINQVFVKSSVTFNGVNYYLYDRNTSTSVNYNLILGYSE